MSETISFIRFDGVFKNEMSGIKTRFSASEVSSKYADNKNAGTGVSYNVWKAAKMWSNNSSNFFVGQKNNGAVVEKINDDNSVQVVEAKRLVSDGAINIYAGHVSGDKESPSVDPKPYLVRSKTIDGYHGTSVLCAIMPFILSDDEAQQSYIELLPYLTMDDTDSRWHDTTGNGNTLLEEFAKILALFSDNIYRRIKNAENLPNGIGLKLPTTQRQIKNISLSILKQPCTLVAGTPYYFSNVSGNIAKKGTVTAVFSAAELDALKLYDDEPYTDEQKSYIPDMGDKFSWSNWIIDTVKHIKLSGRYSEPLRTCYFIGPAGSGKSKGTAGMAQLLQIPYFYQTCSPDMEIFDFFGQIFPNTNPSQKLNFEDIRKEMNLPSVEDIMLDIESSYIRIFHKEYDNTSEADIICEMINKVNAEVSRRCNTKDYTYVEGSFVKAIRHGYLFEVQEIGIVRRPGVAVALNSILEAGKHVYCTLPTGEMVYRHPNTVICFTSNDEYEGTNNLNQSVLSRMGHVLYFTNATVDEMVARTKAIVTDFNSDKTLQMMAQTICEINQYCREKDISSGVCGQRELNNWAMESMIEMEIQGEDKLTMDILRKTCQSTVLNKVSQNRDDIADVAYAKVNPKYGEFSLTV